MNQTETATPATLYYVHDPMCSWCYGFAAGLHELLAALPAGIAYRRLLGGLAADSNQPMSAAMQASIRDNWRAIETTIPGTSFNHDFWERCSPVRSTYPACRAVIAARLQHDDMDVTMTTAIQRAYYRQARNPSELKTLLALAHELTLDTAAFETAMASAEVEEQLNTEIRHSAALGVSSYPALRLQRGNTVWPIEIDYRDASTMLAAIRAHLP